MGLPRPASLSPSSISAFKQCPLAFRFSYVERLPEPPSPATTKGTLVHRALQILMTRPAPERTVPAALDDLDVALAELTGAGADLIDERPRAGLFGLEVAFVHPDSVHGVLSEVVTGG